MKTAPEEASTAFYTGGSMRGIFRDGDLLDLRAEPFDSLTPGDVVAVFDREPFYVHRVVRRTADRVVTMGDNNLTPDKLELTPESSFRLVTRRHTTDGRAFEVARGADGMRQFRRQQRKRRFFAVFTRMLAVFRPLKSLRIPAREASRFRDGSVQWSWHGIPVAVRRNDGRLVYLKWSRRMVFRVPEPEEGGA